MNNMLTIEEVKNFLAVDQVKIDEYLKKGKLKAYKIGGVYVRFRKEDILTLKSEIQPRQKPPFRIFSRIADFWRFNNFYILSLLAAGAIIFFMIKH